MRPKGYNPMRWDCESSGCFNIKRRPKIEVFADCFPRRINFGDVDGLVEINQKFLMLEWKGDGGAVGTGQRLTYQAFTKQPDNMVIVVHGDAETMTVEGYQLYWNGKPQTFTESDLSGVKDVIGRWATHVQAGKAA